MIEPRTLLLGALATVSFSLTGYVLIPALGIETEPTTLADGSAYPEALGESAKRGREAYRDLGCMYCHSQQVRPSGFGADQERGWGRRGSLPIDYVGQSPPLLGTMRTGPDLADIGSRQPSDTWHLVHLYDPQLTSAGSNMPPFRFLFDHVPEPAEGALTLPEGATPAGVAVVPTERALDLVAYLKALKQAPDVTGGSDE